MTTEAPAPKTDPPERSARGAYILLAALIITGSLLGVLAYSSFKKSDAVLAEKVAELETSGQSLTAIECIGDVLLWFDECQKTAIPELCLKGIEKTVEVCLAAQDRYAECDSFKDEFPDGRWAFDKCREHDINRGSPRVLKKSCVAAYRTLFEYCRLKAGAPA